MGPSSSYPNDAAALEHRRSAWTWRSDRRQRDPSISDSTAASTGSKARRSSISSLAARTTFNASPELVTVGTTLG
jgi:hypothetical protein